ncbi:protein kinase [Candidatus Uabimicrobium sp. HlEnr_7]|uniref:protein kinase domain-containing protein n=1 Tax=Candidatus Uabimicrobium helgolandensis TaxID=3095367 RepID=UPI00355759C1
MDKNTNKPNNIDINSLFANKYKIIKMLGKGGMGKVYKTIDTELNRPVALKVLLDSTGDSEKSKKKRLKRFQQESISMAKIQHKNIAEIYNWGIFQNMSFLTMEIVEDGDLQNYMKNNKLSLTQIAQIMRQVAEGTHCAHRAKVIHRDLKPGNILMDGDTPKITDFGLAKTNNVSTKMSRSGQVIGTLQYMPPEQANGEKVDHRADVYALGVILYEMLTGRLPFESSNAMNLFFQLVKKEVVPPSQIKKKIPKVLENICLKALEKKPEDRYQTASAFGDDLYKFTKGKTPKSSIHYSPKWIRTKRQINRYKHFFIILVALLLLFVIYRNSEEQVTQVTQQSKTTQPKVITQPKVTTQPNLDEWQQRVLQKLKNQNLEHSQIYSYAGHHYIVINKASSWSTAQEICESLDGYLVTITDIQEENFIKKIFTPGKKYWLGMQRKSIDQPFQWITGEPTTYNNWSILKRAPHHRRDVKGKKAKHKKARSYIKNTAFINMESDEHPAWGNKLKKFPLIICEWGKNRTAGRVNRRSMISRFYVENAKLVKKHMFVSKQLPKDKKGRTITRFILNHQNLTISFGFSISKKDLSHILLVKHYSGKIIKPNGQKIRESFIDITINNKKFREKFEVDLEIQDYFNITDYLKVGENIIDIRFDPSSRTVYFLRELMIYTISQGKKNG